MPLTHFKTHTTLYKELLGKIFGIEIDKDKKNKKL